MNIISVGMALEDGLDMSMLGQRLEHFRAVGDLHFRCYGFPPRGHGDQELVVTHQYIEPCSCLQGILQAVYFRRGHPPADGVIMFPHTFGYFFRRVGLSVDEFNMQFGCWGKYSWFPDLVSGPAVRWCRHRGNPGGNHGCRAPCRRDNLQSPSRT